MKRITSKYSGNFYEVEILENAEVLPYDAVFVTSLLDDITEIMYQVYKDNIGNYYAIEE